MPIPTAVKFGIAAAACGYCWKVGDKGKAASLAEKIAAMIMCGGCAGIAGTEVVKHGVGIHNQLKNPPSVNQVQQAPAQQGNIKAPPKGSLTQRALANRNPGRRAGFVPLISISDQEERKTFDYSSQKEIKRQQQQQREIKDLEYEQYCEDFNLI